MKKISIVTMLLGLAFLLLQAADEKYIEASSKAKAQFTTLVASGATSAFDVSRVSPHKHTVQWVTTGSPATCTLSLEASISGPTGPWASISGDQTCTSSSMFHVVERSVDYIRINLTALTGGSSPTVTPYYMGKW
jgi:hypothetical protein